MKETEAQGEESGIGRDAWGQKEKKIYRIKNIERHAENEERESCWQSWIETDDDNDWGFSLTHLPHMRLRWITWQMQACEWRRRTHRAQTTLHMGAHPASESFESASVCQPLWWSPPPHRANLQHLWPSPINPTRHHPSTTPHRPIAFGFATIKHTFSHTASLSLCCYSNLAACALTPSSLRGYRRTTDFPCVSASGYFLYSAMPSVSLKIV